MSAKGLPKIADVEAESQYGYVFGVSGPGESQNLFEIHDKFVPNCISIYKINHSIVDIYCCDLVWLVKQQN